MDRDLEVRSGGEAGDEAADRRKAQRSMGLGELCTSSATAKIETCGCPPRTCVVHDMASHLELFDGDLAVCREQQNVPVLVPHSDGGCWRLQCANIWLRVPTLE